MLCLPTGGGLQENLSGRGVRPRRLPSWSSAAAASEGQEGHTVIALVGRRRSLRRQGIHSDHCGWPLSGRPLAACTIACLGQLRLGLQAPVCSRGLGSKRLYIAPVGDPNAWDRLGIFKHLYVAPVGDPNAWACPNTCVQPRFSSWSLQAILQVAMPKLVVE